jgi:hypothetical protein
MAVLDFPTSPAVGQVHLPSPGQPGYVWDGTAWKMIALPDTNPASGLRNVIINGSLDIAQRNFQAPGFVGSAWTFDRFMISTVGSSVTQTAPFCPVDLAIPGDPRFYYNVVVNSVAGANNYVLWQAPIENVRQLSGGKATLSLSVRGDAGKYFTVEFYQYFGTGGSPSAIVFATPQKIGPCNGSWQRFAVTLDVPSIAGKVLGSNGDTYINVVFWLDAGSNWAARTLSLGQQSGTWSFAQLQLEKGSLPSYPERRPYGYELSLCQRYYEYGTQLQEFPSPNGTNFGQTYSAGFKVMKRATPTMGRGFGNVSASVGNSCYAPGPGQISDNYWLLGGNSIWTNVSQYCNWTANAEVA